MLVCPLLSDAGTGPSSPDCLSTSHCSGCMVNFGAVADVKKKGLIQVIKRHVKKKLCRLRFYFINTSRDDMRSCNGEFLHFLLNVYCVCWCWGRDEGWMAIIKTAIF